ncbi:hypothetical protein VHEMI07071 [[Torrubiella] hemipterigena]|uniref:NAD-dependent epimerase/dehydratase domain-containing protein n=1 Tax=[Torrubiella] hemipterigena TaxID=1531966 RepID=A0A0A1TKZ9_9HYPO|nr:hypothetical protein VHEMI07071 [[Torrubiella] hemipterigena]
MHLLILGGTSFVGRALALEAVARNHRVTLLNRGTSTQPPAGVTNLLGDRLQSNGLDALDGLTFDAVVDTWSSEPAPAVQAMQRLKGRMGHYTYISTLSVYDESSLPGHDILADESADTFDITAPDANKKVYQFNKRSVEVAAEQLLPDIPCLMARAGVILGPHEHKYIERGRLPWWLQRLHEGGPTLAPGPRDLKLQLVDARDLANFVLDNAEKGTDGAFNIISDHGSLTMGDLLEAAREATGNRAQLQWHEPQRILDAGISPFMELPLWLDPSSTLYDVIYGWDTTKVKGAGLVCRPIEETIRDTWAWMQGDAKPVPAPEGMPVGGLSKEKESIVLAQQ